MTVNGIPETVYLTRERLVEIEQELRELKTNGRKSVAMKIADARGHGDLSENAEYDEARNAYLKLEKDINEAAGLIARARVIGDSDICTECAGVGSLVQIEEVENGSRKQEFRLVGPTESDPDNGKISHLCPIGKSLMDAKLGDIVSVKTPGGEKKYRVVTISK